MKVKNNCLRNKNRASASVSTYRYCYNCAVCKGSHHDLLQNIFLQNKRLTSVISPSYILLCYVSSKIKEDRLIFHTTLHLWTRLPAMKCCTGKSRLSKILLLFLFSSHSNKHINRNNWQRQKNWQFSLLNRSHGWLLGKMMPLLPVDPCGNGANCYTHCSHVYRCCGFIHDKNAALANKGPGQAEELSLPYTEVLSSFCYHCIYNKNQLVKSEHSDFEKSSWKLCALFQCEAKSLEKPI